MSEKQKMLVDFYPGSSFGYKPGAPVTLEYSDNSVKPMNIKQVHFNSYTDPLTQEIKIQLNLTLENPHETRT